MIITSASNINPKIKVRERNILFFFPLIYLWTIQTSLVWPDDVAKTYLWRYLGCKRYCFAGVWTVYTWTIASSISWRGDFTLKHQYLNKTIMFFIFVFVDEFIVSRVFDVSSNTLLIYHHSFFSDWCGLFVNLINFRMWYSLSF